MNLVAELRRRKVFRVAAAYAVAAWALAQVADLVLENTAAPPWVMQVILLVLALGFPLAVLLAWAFEVTPEGVQRTRRVAPAETPRLGGQDHVLIVLLLAVIVVAGYQVYRMAEADRPAPRAASAVVDAPGDAATEPDPSIAVLPFADLSPDRDQGFFSDGISEEILNALVRVDGLDVASRTSAFAFKDTTRSIPEIAEALDVGYVLEGSVRLNRASDRIRITAQLIDASDDRHIWSETYDRDAGDIFVVQEEIARAITEALQVSLDLAPAAELIRNRTDLDNYAAYLRAVELYRNRGEDLREAIEILERVVADDPDFAPAWATLAASYTIAGTYLDEWRRTLNDVAGSFGRAAYSARMAYHLDPELPSAILREGQRLMYAGEFIEGLALQERALALDPNNDVILEDVAQAWMLGGLHDEAIEGFERLLELAPDNVFYRAESAEALAHAGRFDEAIARGLDAYERNPAFFYSVLRINEFHMIDERFEDARRFLDRVEASPAYAEYTDLERQALADRRRLLEDPEDFEPQALWAHREAILQDPEDFFAGVSRGVVPVFVADEVLITRDPGIINDPRGQRLVKDAGLVELWNARGWPDGCFPRDGGDFRCEW
ncbi:MAG: tetratricopeptide repeat protein [Wenzhouxiangellaceae bacterium]|nr:tetratricopeptide repeat protein [Wenzhouxiangellaceae bacterium]